MNKEITPRKRYQNDRYKRLKAEGICTACCKSPARPGKTSCQPCANEQRAYARLRYLAYVKKEEIPELKGACEICELPISIIDANLDHDHGTTLIRGWLCRSCNQGLGFFRDDPKILRQAADYLERPRLVETSKSKAKQASRKYAYDMETKEDT